MIRTLLVALAAALLTFLTRPVAALTQPGGAAIPAPAGCNAGKPTGLAATFACVCDQPGVCNIGVPCTGPTSCDDGHRAQCETTLAHAFNDNTCIPSKVTGLVPAAEAAVTPETFRPSCPLTFTVLTRGTAIFANGFGWYNVTGQRPDPADLHMMLACNDPPGRQVVLDIKADPAYRGGEIGFFLVTPEAVAQRGRCAGGDCCATLARAAAQSGQIYYSERRFNPDVQSASAIIHLVVFDSHLTPRKFYFAWEDTYGAANNDFTDLVTSVDGVECSGGGAACATGRQGLCGRGVTACASGVLGCVPVLAPSNETCDGLDNDCNGAVDDGARCPSPSDVCQAGRCVHRCSGIEFPCRTAGTQCDGSTGYCVDAACVGVTCPADKTCRGGTCRAACEGVVCPRGQTCTGAACVDLCRGKSCPAGQACREGVCFAGCAQCGGLACEAGTTCDAASGACADTSCPASCPAGAFCDHGACKDACLGVACPFGAPCVAGQCADAPESPGGPATPGDAGGFDPGAPTTPARADAAVPAPNETPEPWDPVRPTGCGCFTAGSSNGPLAALAFLGLALAIGLATARRRRRR